MCAMEKDKKGLLSQITADLLVRSKRREEPSFNISRLREEIKKELENTDEIFGKFRGLVESFRDIIPEEKQRYHAALKALAYTSGLSQKDILKAADNQLAELKILEKRFTSALPEWRDEIKALESKSREIRNEISRLREKIIQLESHEQEILNDKTAREEERILTEKGVGDILADMVTELTDIKGKIEEFTPERVSSQPITPPASLKSYGRAKEIDGGDRESKFRKVSAPQDVEGRKKCPMCGRQVKWYLEEKMWKCFDCSYEETDDMKRSFPIL